MNPKTGWGDLGLSPGEDRTIQLGTLDLRIERSDTELWLRVARLGDQPIDEEGDWTRWTIPPDAQIHLEPAVPDRLLVVSHEHPFNLPPRGRARVYVRIPLDAVVVVQGADGSRFPALDVPSVVLSDTWWGSFTEGELAYWLSTKARASVSPELFEPHLAVCAFELANESSEALPISRFAVRVPHLTLFEAGDETWTDEVHVRYEAAAEGSEIRFGGRPPRERPDGQHLARPRQSPPKGFRALTFGTLKALSSLGF